MNVKILRNKQKLIFAVVILVLILSAKTGQAFVPRKDSGRLMVSGNHHANIEFILNENSLDLIQEIVLTIQSNTPIDKSADIEISLNNGSSWHRCAFRGPKTWSCSFPSSNTPQIHETKDVRISISSWTLV